MVLLCAGLFSLSAIALGVDDNTKQFLQANEGVAFLPFMYIGAKYMVTGYDHLLFLVGVWNDIQVNAYLIDAIIGLSIVYKGFDNLGDFKRLLGFEPNTKAAVLIFGLFHGFGLATKLQEFEFGREGLLENFIAFNIGVELGQLFALTFVLIVLSIWRRHASYLKFSTVTNTGLMCGGLMLTMFQFTGYLIA